MLTNNIKTSKQVRIRFLLIAPLVALPFLVFLLWKLGLGKAVDQNLKAQVHNGLLEGLPELNKPLEEGLSKLDHYERAERDSQRMMELIQNDPYRLVSQGSYRVQPNELIEVSRTGEEEFTPVGNDPSEMISQEIYNRIDELQEVLDSPKDRGETNLLKPLPIQNFIQKSPRSDMEELLDFQNANLEAISQDPLEDKEISELNAMLDKVLDIQHPDRIKSNASKDNLGSEDSIFSIDPNVGKGEITLLGDSDLQLDSFRKVVRFYSPVSAQKENPQNVSILAAVHEKQEITNGSTLKMHLLQKVSIAGYELPKGQLIFAQINFSSQRIGAKVTHIRIGSTILPVDLQVHDLDGIQGINVPGNYFHQSIQESADRSLQDIGISSLDPSWETKIASVGVQAAKNLMSKKIKMKKVFLPADYRVLLFDKKKK